MNKIYTLLLIIIISGCNSSRNASIESLIESGDIDELKKRKKEYVTSQKSELTGHRVHNTFVNKNLY